MRNLPYFSWEVTSECNHRCPYCFNDSGSPKEVSFLSDEELNAISDFLVSQRPVSVTISGGEALMIFDRLKPHIEKLRNDQVQMRILSNGALITEDTAQFCAMWDIHFLVSFPSVDREVFGAMTGRPDSYDQVLAGMDILKKYGVVFQPNVVVAAINLDTVEETVRFLWQRYAPPSVMVSRVTAPSNAGANISDILLSSEQLDQMFDICVALSERENIPIKTCGGFALCTMNSQKSYEIFGKVCGGGIHDCLINSKGDVRVCARDSQVYGNIFRELLNEIRCRMTAWREAPIPEDCRKCRMAEICRGGCHMSSMEPERGPGSLDCHAKPQGFSSVRYQRKLLAKKLRPLYRYRIVPFVSAKESDCVRLSVGIAYDYFPQKVADYLCSHTEITLLSALRLCHWNAFSVMRRLLYTGVIQE